jgi:hypothetical protein
MSGYWIVLPVRGSVYVAAFAYCIDRIIIVANAATNKKVNITFLFIPPIIMTAKDGSRYISYVLIEVKLSEEWKNASADLRTSNEYAYSGVSDSTLLISFLSFGHSSKCSSGLSIFFIQTDNSRYHVYQRRLQDNKDNVTKQYFC